MEELPEQTTTLELPPRTIVDWQLENTKTAMRLADGGDLSLAAELVEQLINGDGRISGPLAQRTAVLGLPVKFKAGNGARGAQAARDIDPANEGDFEHIFVASEWERIHAWGLVLGVCPVRNLWWEKGKPRKHNGRNVGAVEFWHPRNLRFDWTTREWKLRVDGGKEIVIDPDGDEFWLYLPYGLNRPWAHGLWFALKLYWIAGLLSFEDWNRANEKLGIGAFVARAPEGTADTTIKAYAKELKKLGREKAFALPAGWILELIESEAKTAESFEKLINLCDTCKAITILGQNLTTEVKGGSYAAADVHKNVAGEVLRRDARVVRSQGGKPLRVWARINYSDPEAAPVLELDITPPEDDAARVKTWGDFADSTDKLLKLGLDVDVIKGAELVKVPLKSKNIKKPEPPPPPEPIDVPGEEVPLTPSAKPPGAKAPGRALAGLLAKKLASGDPAGTAPGFVAGQVYTDLVGRSLGEAMAEANRPSLEALLDAIDESTDPADCYDRIFAAYAGKMDHRELGELICAAMRMTALAGIASVTEDAQAK